MVEVLKSFTGLSITVYSDPDVSFSDSFICVEPKDSESGFWEVWSLEADGPTSDVPFEAIEFLPEDKLLHIETDDDLTYDAVRNIIQALELGRELGYRLGKQAQQRAAKFAWASLTGEIDGGALEDAAETYFYQRRKDL